jgi:hypothetical protein
LTVWMLKEGSVYEFGWWLIDIASLLAGVIYYVTKQRIKKNS